MTDGLRLMRKEGIEASELRFSPEHLASLVKLSADGSINSTIASEVFEKLFYEDFDPKRYVTENDLLQRIDENALSGAVEKVLGENPKAVEDYRAGKQKAVGFLVGQMMKETGGSAPPDLVRKALIERLSKEE